MSEASHLLPLLRPYLEEEPARAARLLERMSASEAAHALATLPAELSAPVLALLESAHAADLLEDAAPERIAAVCAPMETAAAASLLAHLPDETLQQTLAALPARTRGDIEEQLSYPADSVARLMGGRMLTFTQDTSAGEALARLRSLGKERIPASYVYVTDGDNHLAGVLNMHDLVLADPSRRLHEIMRGEVFALHAFTAADEAAEELGRRHFFAAPVVDSEKRLLGLVRADRLMQDIQAERGQELQQMVGAGRDERVFSPLRFSLRKRLPWLHVNLLTAFMAAAVVALFEGLIAKITALAVFLPVVAGQGGNAGAQSLAIVMRGMVMREIPKHMRTRLVVKEGVLGGVNGAVTGGVTALIAFAWYGNAVLGLVVGIAMLANLVFAGIAGASIPLLLKAMRLDPAQCSSIVLTTVTDVAGFSVFLTLAMVTQPYLT